MQAANILQAIIHVLASPANAPILRLRQSVESIYFRKNIGVLWHLRNKIKREQYGCSAVCV